MEFVRHHRSIPAIYGKVGYLRNQNIDISSDCFWSPDETSILKEKYPKCGRHIPELISLGYTGDQIAAKALREGIKFDSALPWSKWTNDEDRWLCEHYNKNLSISEIIDEFKKSFNGATHTDLAIRARLKTLRLSTIENIRLWTEAEDALIRTHYPSKGTDIVYMFDNRSRNQIKYRANRLGIQLLAPSTNSKKVRCIENQKIFNSTMEAARWAIGNDYKGHDNDIRRFLKDSSKVLAYGYHWEYLDE